MTLKNNLKTVTSFNDTNGLQLSIILAIQSIHGVKILTKDKLLELRKSIPQGFVGWVYLYITKAKPHLFDKGVVSEHYVTSNENPLKLPTLNGRVVARFWLDEYDIIEKLDLYDRYELGIFKGKFKGKIGEPLGWNDCKRLCLEEDEIYNYIKKKRGYAWHIKKLEIFDKPKELSDFHYYKTKTVYSGMDCPPYVDEVKQTLRKAPQSWMYAYIKERKTK